MKSLRVRLTLWFALGFLTVTGVFIGLTYRHLDLELRRKTFEREFDVNPDWMLKGSFTEMEIRQIMAELIGASLTYSLPLVLVTLLLGHLIARSSLRPIRRLNEQLQTVGPRTLHRRVELPEADEQFRDLLYHLNDMLDRLERSFIEMSEYAAKVAHELRTPLTVLRLKIEQAEARIEPVLAESLESELHRLAHVVEQSLLIAKADQGRLSWVAERVDLCALLGEVLKDFRLLVDDAGRELAFESPERCWVEADPRYCKQIVHSLLNNALTHGRGKIRTRLLTRGDQIRFTVANSVRAEPTPREQTLGLGLRVVRALLSHQPGIKFRRHAGTRGYAVSLVFLGKAWRPLTSPSRAAPDANSCPPPAAGNSADRAVPLSA
jgi:signal transduction histidine kinase